MALNSDFDSSIGGLARYRRELAVGKNILEYSLTPQHSASPNLLSCGFTAAIEPLLNREYELTIAIPRQLPNEIVNAARFFYTLKRQPIDFVEIIGANSFETKNPIKMKAGAILEDGMIVINTSMQNSDREHQYKFQAQIKEKNAGPPISKPVFAKITPPPKTPGSLYANGLRADSAMRGSGQAPPDRQEGMALLRGISQRLEAVESSIKSIIETVKSNKEEEFKTYREALRQWFFKYSAQEIRKRREEAYQRMKDHPAFMAFQDFLKVFEMENPPLITLWRNYPLFQPVVDDLKKNAQETFQRILGVNSFPNFQAVAIASYQMFLESEFIGRWQDDLEEGSLPPFEAFNPETAYRRYVFAAYQNALRQAFQPAAEGDRIDEKTNEGLNRIVKESIPQHFDEIELLEQSHPAADERRRECVDQYLNSLLAPLGMKLIAAAPGDDFDPKIHTNKNQSPQTGAVIQSVVKRGYQRVDGYTMRRPMVFA
ncbi:MAG: hypothetical protein AB1656_27245 [Candidatus Omnitrophota bacterium]